MRTRDKILLLLFTVTSALGGLVILQSRQDEVALLEFRWLLFNHPLRNLADAVAANPASVWYGALSLFAMVTMIVVFRSVSNAELRAFKNRLIQAEVAKGELETSLQDSLWKEKYARTAKESAIQDLEASSRRMIELEDRLSEAEQILRRRDAELETWRAKARGMAERPVETASDTAQEQIQLREQLRQQTDLIEVKEAAIQRLEKESAEKVDAMRAQLTLKEKLAQQCDKELAALRAQLSETEAAKNDAASLLTEELRKERQTLKAKEAAVTELEKSFTGKMRDLRAGMKEIQALLDRRSAELEAFRSEVNVLRDQLADTAAARERAESALRQEAAKTALLQAKDAAFNKLQESSNAKLRALEAEIDAKETLCKERDKELAALRTHLSETGAAKDATQSLLAEQLQKERQALKAKERAVADLEKSLAEKVRTLEAQVGEKEEAVRRQSAESEAFRSEVNLLREQLADAAAGRERVENALRQEAHKTAALLQSKDGALREIETQLGAKLLDLENKLRDRDALLQERDADLASVRTQLTQIGSAKKESENLLRGERNRTIQALQEKDAAIQELQESLDRAAATFKDRFAEQQTVLKRRDEELNSLRAEIGRLEAEPTNTDVGGDWSLRLLESSPDSLTHKLEQSSKAIRELESLVRKQEELLKINEEKAQRLESDLKEKRTELAKREIAVWQAYERRTLWRQRLAKIGISIKDRGADL